jgi:hypothetical protein
MDYEIDEKPPPPGAWSGRFLAVWGDNGESDFDLKGYVLRPGDGIPGKPGYVLDQFETSDLRHEDGRWYVRGIFRCVPS